MKAETDSSGFLTVGLAAAVGGLAAVFVDLFQKGDASAIFKLTATFNRYADEFYPAAWGDFPDIPVIATGLLLVAFAVFLAFVYGAQTRNTAFFSGASVISVLMTLVPYNAALPPPSGTTVNKVSWQDERGTYKGMLVPASYTVSAEARPILVATTGAQLPVTVVVHLPIQQGQNLKTPLRIDGRLYDKISGKVWQLSYADPDPTVQTSAKEVSYHFNFVIETGAPQGTTLADLRLGVRAEGYRWSRAARTVTNPGQPVTLDVTLEPSGLPKAFEGLGRVFDRPQF